MVWCFLTHRGFECSPSHVFLIIRHVERLRDVGTPDRPFPLGNIPLSKMHHLVQSWNIPLSKMHHLVQSWPTCGPRSSEYFQQENVTNTTKLSDTNRDMKWIYTATEILFAYCWNILFAFNIKQQQKNIVLSPTRCQDVFQLNVLHGSNATLFEQGTCLYQTIMLRANQSCFTGCLFA
jgi:hypothetical protein